MKPTAAPLLKRALAPVFLERHSFGGLCQERRPDRLCELEDALGLVDVFGLAR
jgi:hypothetical protein